MPKPAEPMMKMARFCSRSEMVAMLKVKMKATAYGGTVSSWALAAEYPSWLMMDGYQGALETATIRQ
jgi:hypothetical protein